MAYIKVEFSLTTFFKFLVNLTIPINSNYIIQYKKSTKKKEIKTNIDRYEETESQRKRKIMMTKNRARQI